MTVYLEPSIEYNDFFIQSDSSLVTVCTEFPADVCFLLSLFQGELKHGAFGLYRKFILNKLLGSSKKIRKRNQHKAHFSYIFLLTFHY